jgi:hypothetical protein
MPCPAGGKPTLRGARPRPSSSAERSKQLAPPPIRYAFRSNSLGEPRLVWHPGVHEHVEEECSLFLIRLADNTAGSISAVLAEVAGVCRIDSYCAYVILGHYDALFRVWARAPVRHQLRRELARRSGYFLETREIRIDAIHYREINDDTVDEAEIEAKWDKVSAIVRADRTNDLEGDVKLRREVDDFLERSLLVISPPVHSGEIKFYFIFLPNRDRPEEPNKLARRLLDGAEIEAVATYIGSGYASLLLKGIARDFAELSSLNADFDHRAQGAGYRLETLIISDVGAYECDTIDSVMTGELTSDITRMLRAANGLLDDAIDPDQLERANGIAKSFSAHSDLLAIPETKPRLIALLSALLRNDPEELYVALGYIVQIEAYVRQYLTRSVLPLLGDDWHARLRTSLNEETMKKVFRGSEEVARVDEWTLGASLYVADWAQQNSPDVSARLNTDLPSNALTLLRALTRQRNIIGHWKFDSDPSENGTGVTSDLDADTLIEALRLWQRLREATGGEGSARRP